MADIVWRWNCIFICLPAVCRVLQCPV